MDQLEVKRVSEHICDWLDDHAGFSFNALCREIGADSGNMQKYRKSRCFLEKHLAAIEGELVKVREYVPLNIEVVSVPPVMDGSKVSVAVLDEFGQAGHTEAVGGENQYDGFKGKSFTEEAYDAGLPVQVGDDVVQKGVDTSLFDKPEFFSGSRPEPVVRHIESTQPEYAYVDVPLHPDQERFPGRLLEEGMIEYRLRMAANK